jgi:hypothetical protein
MGLVAEGLAAEGLVAEHQQSSRESRRQDG